MIGLVLWFDGVGRGWNVGVYLIKVIYNLES